MVRAVVLAFFLLGAASARADCDHFKWKLDQEKAWFTQTPEPVPAGGQIDKVSGAYEIALKPESGAGYVVAPKTLTPGAFGAVVRVAQIPQAGVYQLTLSSEAWVDIIQNDARARTRNVSRQRDCANFKKSVRFTLAAGPAVVEFSGVTAPSIAFALAAAP
jgi:hypothetical protein